MHELGLDLPVSLIIPDN